MTNVEPSTEAFPYPTLKIQGAKVRSLTNSLVNAGIHYRLGAKIDPVDLEADQLAPNGIDAVDCSGFVRWALFHALGCPPDYNFADGSDNQHDQVLAVGFKASSFEDAHDADGWVRIAFLTQEASGEGIGHVVLIWDGATYESYGSHGPGSREWGSEPFMQAMNVFVLG